MNAADWQAVRLTAELATLTTLLLLVAGTPVAWWLARTRSAAKPLVASLVAMPLVLPPSVLGFYLLVLMGPQGPVGQLTQSLGLGRLPFTFAGLVVASVLYSMPFVVQPLQQAFEAIPERTLEAAATLRAGPWDRFFTVALPLARPGLLTASVLGFAHTVGEFGVVLMIGGNIPGPDARAVGGGVRTCRGHRVCPGPPPGRRHGGVCAGGAGQPVHAEPAARCRGAP
jgi:molybdate transport system permease protein